MAEYKIENGKAVIPEGTTTIEDYAFDGCADLKSIIIPDSLIFG